MIVLGIDTATPGLGVALAGPDGLVAETIAQVGLRHSQGLLPAVEWLLRHAGLTVADLGAVAVTLGPGSFTAVRIGLNTAKGLCMSRGLPLAGMSTLAAAAAKLPGASRPVAPWLDAKKREVYAGYYDTSTGIPRAIEDDAAVAPDDWLSAHPDGALFLGDGARIFRALIEERLGDRAWFAPPWVPDSSAGAVAILGRARAIAGDTIDPDRAAPVYLRRPQAVDAREA